MRSTRDRLGFLPLTTLALCWLGLAPSLRAQCALSWTGGSTLAASDGTINSVVEWDPSGGQGTAPLIVCGGTFTRIANIAANNVAFFDPATGSWSALGSGLTGFTSYSVVSALTVYQGNLVATGHFTVGGTSGLAMWDGTTWSSLGSLQVGGTNGIGGALTVTNSGDLVVAGYFDTVGGVSAANIARFNGTNWSPFGAGFPSGVVYGLGTTSNDEVVAVGTLGSSSVARWTNNAWVNLGPYIPEVRCVSRLANGTLVIGGAFGASSFNGTAFTTMGSLANVASLTLTGGNLIATGSFGGGGVSQWDATSSSWVSLGSPGALTFALAPTANGDLVTVSYHSQVAGRATLRIRSGSVWDVLVPNSTNGVIYSSTVMPNGDVVVGGDFTIIDGVNANFVARFDGSTWSPLGVGLNDSCQAVLALPDGNVVAGGYFTQAGGSGANRIARFNGSSWSAFGSGMNGPVLTLAPSSLAAYDFYVGGNFTTAGGTNAAYFAARGNTPPQFVGITPALNDIVRTILTTSGGVFVGGDFTTAGSTTVNRVVRMTGSSFQAVSSGTNGPVYDLAALPNGDLVAGGEFDRAGSVVVEKIARISGTTYSALATGMNPTGTNNTFVNGLHVLPDGSLIAAGRFTNASGVTGTQNIARFSGSTWSALASNGTPTVPLNYQAVPFAYATLPDGNLLVTGAFTATGTESAASFVTLATDCPATGTNFGSGCSSSAGPVALAMTSRPWIGSSYRSRTTGIPSGALVFAVVGLTQLSPAQPLTNFVAEALAGCQALANPDATTLLLHSSGIAENTIAIPLTPSFVGVSLFEQSLVLEISGSAVSAATSSNGVQVIAGAF